jgi:hypothetical protein
VFTVRWKMEFIYNCNFNNKVISQTVDTARFLTVNAGFLDVIQRAFESFCKQPNRSLFFVFFLSSRSNLDSLSKFHFAWLPTHPLT